MEKIIVSSSFGADSTAMLHLMLEKGIQIDEVMFFDTEWDFPEMESHIALVEKNTGIRTVHLRNYRRFDELLSRWVWPDKSGGWCVARKITACNRFFRGVKGTTECIGFNTDECHRCERPEIKKKKWHVRFPLIEHGFSKVDVLNYCKSLGYDWGGLYDVFSRVSCFCCPKAGQKRLDKLRYHFPYLYERYLAMDEIAQSAQKPKLKVTKTNFKPSEDYQADLFPKFEKAI